MNRDISEFISSWKRQGARLQEAQIINYAVSSCTVRVLAAVKRRGRAREAERLDARVNLLSSLKSWSPRS